MARYTAKPLRALDRLYKFVGGLVTSGRVDLESPISLVHDVSRSAELATFEGKFGGTSSLDSPYFTINVDNVHASASKVLLLIGVYDNQGPGWALSDWTQPDPTKETVWVLGVFASADSGVITRAWVSLSIDPKAGAGSGIAPRVMIWGTLGSGTLLSGTDGQRPQVPIGNYGLLPVPIPISNKLLNNTVLEFMSDSSDATTIDFFVWCIRLPNGVLPPGMS